MMNQRIEESAATYRAAMALNNLGVARMGQGGQFYDAIETFQDTFSIINTKQSSVPSSGVFADVFLPSTSATRFQATPMKQEQQQVSLHPMLQICPCDDDDVSAMMIALPSAAVFAPISLRSRDFYDPQGFQANSNLFLAITMYNLGLANLLAQVQAKKYQHILTTTTSNSAPRTTQQHELTLFHRAEVSLNTAQVMIDRHLLVIGEGDNAAQGFEKLETMLVLGMILKSLMWMYRLENQNNEAEQTRAMLSRVLNDIQRHQDQLHILNNIKISTSSAA
jgi:hypothetical protein